MIKDRKDLNDLKGGQPGLNGAVSSIAGLGLIFLADGLFVRFAGGLQANIAARGLVWAVGAFLGGLLADAMFREEDSWRLAVPMFIFFNIFGPLWQIREQQFFGTAEKVMASLFVPSALVGTQIGSFIRRTRGSL